MRPFRPKMLFQKKAVEPEGATKGSSREKSSNKKPRPVSRSSRASPRERTMAAGIAIRAKRKKFPAPRRNMGFISASPYRTRLSPPPGPVRDWQRVRKKGSRYRPPTPRALGSSSRVKARFFFMAGPP